MKVTIVFPPPWEPTMPYLAPAALAASVTGAGHSADIADAALGFVHHLLRPETVRSLRTAIAHSDRLRALIGQGRPERIGPVLDLGTRLEQAVPAAKDVLQHPGLFQRPDLRGQAWQTVLAAHRLASLAHYPSQITPDSLASHRDLLNPEHLLDVAADARINPYRAYLRDILAPQILAGDPDTVAVSVASPFQLTAAVTLAQLLRGSAPGLPVIAGGAFLTAVADDLPLHPLLVGQFHAVLTGDGESALGHWCASGRPPRPPSIPGAYYVQDGRVVHCPSGGAARHGHWPTPDFTGADLPSYLAPAPVLPLLTQRGCYYRRCAFCSGILVHGGQFQERPVERVAADLAALRDRHGIRHVSLTDQAATPRMLAGLSKALAGGAAPGWRWFAQTRIEPGLTAGVLRAAHQAGCRLLVFGLESAVDRVRNLMDKGGDARLARRILEDCARLGIAVHLFLIAGFPGETEEEARRSVDWVAAAPAAPGSSAFVHPFAIERGSRIFAAPERYGVRLVPAPPGAIPYQFDYEVREGMPPAVVQRLVPELSAALGGKWRGATPSLAHSLLAAGEDESA